MLLNDDPERMRHIVEAAEEAVGYVAGIDRQEFLAQRMLLHSVARCLEIVGEAANRLSPKLRANNPDVPWPNMIGMRNVIIHAYFDLDWDIIWHTAHDELPELLPRLREILRRL